MLTTFFLFLITFIETLAWGFLIKCLLKIDEKVSLVDLSIWGFFTLSTFLGVVHFFLPLNTWLQTFLLPTSLLLLVCFRQAIAFALPTAKSFWLALLIFSLYIIVKTSLPIQLVDSYLYHGQIIHWYRNFPIVKGLGNLFYAFSLNSNYHLFIAPLSFDKLLQQPLHHLVLGYFLWLFGFYLLKKSFEYPSKAWIFLLLLLWFLIGFWNWEASASPDPIFNIFILIGMIEMLYPTKTSLPTLWLICIFLPFVKQTGFIFSLVIGCGLGLSGRSFFRRKYIFFIGIVAFALWSSRNLFMSGRLIYPFILNESFKHTVPAEIIHAETEYVSLFAKRPAADWRVAKARTLLQWLPDWLGYQRKTDLILLCAAIVAMGCLLSRIRKCASVEKTLLVCCLFGIGFWLYKIPYFRFAYGYLLGSLLLFLNTLIFSIKRQIALMLFGIVCICGLAYVHIFYHASTYWLLPGTYEKKVARPTQGPQQLIAVPVDFCGYDLFPCMPNPKQYRPIMFSDQLSDGFYTEKQ